MYGWIGLLKMLLIKYSLFNPWTHAFFKKKLEIQLKSYPWIYKSSWKCDVLHHIFDKRQGIWKC